MKSESIGELAQALAKAQVKMKAAELNAVNPFLKNRYADLGAVIEAARQPLADNGLSFTQLVISTDNSIGVETVLMHTSGEWVSGVMSLPLGDEKGKSLAQVAGSIITYLRRYSLAAILGIYAGDDDDGADHKQTKKPAQEAQKPTNGKMSLETAQTITDSKGVLYCTMTREELAEKSGFIAKALNTDKAKNDPKHRDELHMKQDAIAVLLSQPA